MKYLIIFILVLLTYNYYQISKYKIVDISFASYKVNRSLKITQISDFHSSKFINLDKLTKDIYGYDPDIIILTGDIIDGRNQNIDRGLELIDRLNTFDIDIYFVTGNHEYRNENYDEFIKYLKDAGIIILDNKIVYLEKNNIKLAGVNFGVSKVDYNNLAEKLNEDSYNILLSHSPKYPLQYTDYKEDLIISGHTHGGQVRIPFVGAVVSPSEGFLPKYDKGIYDLENTKLYIDSGLGTSVVPVRLFNRADISNITINPLD